MNILIVEDDAFYLDIIVKMVRGWTHDVTCAESGRAALEKAAAKDFDLFLLDVFLPDMTAMDLIPMLRSFRPVGIEMWRAHDLGQWLPMYPPFPAAWQMAIRPWHHVSTSPPAIPDGGFSPVRF